MKCVRRYIYGILIALDQLLNAMLAGHHAETLCLRAARAWKHKRKWGCLFCRVIEYFHHRHCRIVAHRNKLIDMPQHGLPHILDDKLMLFIRTCAIMLFVIMLWVSPFLSFLPLLVFVADFVIWVFS